MDNFTPILIFMLLGTLFIMGGLLTSFLLRRKNPGNIKESSYECGEIAIGDAYVKINSRFYIIAIVFLIFEVEVILLFPWSIVFANKEFANLFPSWSIFSFMEMTVFILLLVIGYAYVLRKGYLNYIQPSFPSLNKSINKEKVTRYQNVQSSEKALRQFTVFDQDNMTKKESLTITKVPSSPLYNKKSG